MEDNIEVIDVKSSAMLPRQRIEYATPKIDEVIQAYRQRFGENPKVIYREKTRCGIVRLSVEMTKEAYEKTLSRIEEKKR